MTRIISETVKRHYRTNKTKNPTKKRKKYNENEFMKLEANIYESSQRDLLLNCLFDGRYLPGKFLSVRWH